MFNFLKKRRERRRFKKLCALRIGSGCSRIVYVCRHDPQRVIKVLDTSSWSYHRWANVMEWQIWSAVEGTKYEKYFAKCYEISYDGKYLMQERIEGVGTVKLDKKVQLPDFIADMHEGNVGVRGKQHVIVDYALLMVKGRKSSW